VAQFVWFNLRALFMLTVFLDAATVSQVTGNTASSGAVFDNIVGPYTLT
jgi:hypothetical protein